MPPVPAIPPWLLAILKQYGWQVAPKLAKALDIERVAQRRNAIRRAKTTNNGKLAPLLVEGKLRYVVFSGDRPVEAFPPVTGDLPEKLQDFNGYGLRTPEELLGSKIRRRVTRVRLPARRRKAVEDDDGAASGKASAAVFKTMTDELPQLLDELTGAAPQRAGDHLQQPTAAGIYLLSEGVNPMYVGQTRNLRQRLRLHTAPGSRENQASFAFRLAAESATRTGLTVIGTRKERAADPDFAALFAEARARVAEMEVRTLAMDDPIRRTVFEVFVAQALDLPHNDFETH